MRLKGILVSEDIDNINFRDIKKNNIDIVFIRIGYTSYGKNKEKIKDNRFDLNYKKIKKYNIKVSAYYESCAVTEEEAKEEAKFINEILKYKKLSYPISILIIDSHSTIIYSDKNQLNLSKEELSKVILTLYKEIEKNGKPMFIISYKNWFDNNLNSKEILKNDIAIISDNFNKFDNNSYDIYKDNIIYLCDKKCNNDNILIKLENNCLINKVKRVLQIPIKTIKKVLK